MDIPAPEAAYPEREKSPIQIAADQQSESNFNRIFSGELLKSELRRSHLLLSITVGSLVLGVLTMGLGRAHFESLGDHSGGRYWILVIMACYMGYQLLIRRLLKLKIQAKNTDSGLLGALNSVVDPSLVTAWLVVEAFLFDPGAMFDSPLSYGYPLMIFFSSLQLSWRLCLMTGFVAATQYMVLIAWYSLRFTGVLPHSMVSYLPLHGIRAACFLVAGAGAAFIAYEIRKSIHQTLQNLKERDFVVSIFGRYLSDEIVDDILRSPEGLRLGGRRRTLTVMMTDLRGFTSLSETLAPEAVIAMLNNCLATLTEVIVKYQGTIDEFIGDAILAIFGAPFAAEDDVERAVACALEMQLAMEKVNAWNRHQGFPALEMGIGIHTGPVVVGNIGSEQRSKYGVVGSTVNLTSRIESYTVGGQILVSGATAELLGTQLQTDFRRTILPKGYADPIEICSVVGIQGKYTVALPQQTENLIRLNTPLEVSFVKIEGKDLTGQHHAGQITALSEKSAWLSSPVSLEALSNLSLEIHPFQADTLQGKLLAKVVQSQQQTEPTSSPEYLLRFTALSPEIAAFLKAHSPSGE